MSAGKSLGAPLLLALLVLLAAAAITLIVMGRLPVGIALLAVSVALLPAAWRSVRAPKPQAPGADNAG